MTKINEDELDSIFTNIIFLIYRNTCAFKHLPHEVPCGGGLETSHLISRKDKYFRWDLNNALVMCNNHHRYWHGTYKMKFSQQNAFNDLCLHYPRLANFVIENKGKTHMFKPDLEAIVNYLKENANDAINAGKAPFVSLYGKLDGEDIIPSYLNKNELYKAV